MKRLIWVALTAMLVIGMLAACGGKEEKKEAAGETVTMEAKNWEFDKAEYTVPADKDFNLELKNVEGAHGLLVQGEDVTVDGNSSEVLNLKPGKYKVVCSVPCGAGHAKMEATLVAK
ncbi:cytochrome C oxidase subunit II [Fictibacillus iocasae]|uniref:Cytochrome C oxidase subunit II n=1 Tax=Fictibacillus iocasae TaxID=2715437 RepID=A0ABW2NSV2_9BACL